MHWVLIALLALGAGFLYPILSGKLSSLVPGSLTGNTIGQAFFTGAFILVTVMIVAFVLKLFAGGRKVIPG